MFRAKQLLGAGLVSVSMFGSLASCSAAQTVTDGAKRIAADVLVPVEQENQLGAEMKKELSKELTLIDDSPAGIYVAKLGALVLRAAKRSNDVPAGINIRFHTVQDDEQVNAFAIPGGDIYMYTGLLKTADTAAEVVAVLGHEVAHVTRRHIAKRLVAQYGLETVVGLALGQDPGLLGQLVSQVAVGGALLHHSRGDEQDSDNTGIPYAVAAGYNPIGFIKFFEKLRSDADNPLFTFMMSHPLPAERIENAKVTIKSLGRKRPTKEGADEHTEVKNQL